MGRNQSQRKVRKLDKTKVQLKVKLVRTKFLPKGLNETKTNFKIKPIILPEQLKQKDSTEPLSKRKLNIKDILSRLRHHNMNVRHDCLNELKQIINSHIDELSSSYLAQVLQGLPPLLLDDSRAVRHAAMGCLQKIMEQVPAAKIKPFMPILSSYLRCSMTNLNRSIQEDSLGFLGILLKCVPAMIAEESHKVLPNLFALISKFKVHAKPIRTLSVDLNSKVSSVRWHIQVLSGMYGFLKSIDTQASEKLQARQSYIQYSANQKAAKYVPVIYNTYLNSTIAFEKNAFVHFDSKEDIIEKNLNTLIHLLYEIWMEVAPVRNMQDLADATILNNDCAAILSCILNVMQLLLHRMIQQNEDNLTYLAERFFTAECQKFIASLLSYFPYAGPPDHSKTAKSTVHKLLGVHLRKDPKFVRENLLVCYLFCNLHRRLQKNTQLSEAQRILDYVKHCLTTRGSINSLNVDCLLLVIRTLLFHNLEWHRKVDVQKILIRFVKFYETMPKLESAKHDKSILHLLCEVSQLSHLNENVVYLRWMSSISAHLEAERVDENVVDALLLVGRQRHDEFLSGLRQRMPQILRNYKNITVDSVNHNELAKIKILCLFSHLPHLEQAELDALEKFHNECGEHTQERSIALYLLNHANKC